MLRPSAVFLANIGRSGEEIELALLLRDELRRGIKLTDFETCATHDLFLAQSSTSLIVHIRILGSLLRTQATVDGGARRHCHDHVQ